ncbi:hypothetical protein [Natrarchaeobius chitinivorans]|uniref:PGF-pre-PGF domain-containing protein n=1 Tax=Natrarchaeobius chitinivorans TaxID=1679083 RepID=A0A3N6MQX5_NATCH|nr:hypothetical protein [Natrarchaeobius chitinivorans]RQG97036.1 hypothetical protein EA473_02855 [Natrarchaeobius chitinivorans]
MKSNASSAVAVALLLIVSGVGGVVVGANTGTAAQASTQSADSYVVEQGDLCQPIEPLSTDGTVESFYDYRNHETHPDADPEERQYSSYGTEHLQEDDTSLLFLHQGTDGTSLVVIHDQVNGDTEGGVATFDIVGLPAESEWVVQDDLYDGESNMAEWDEGEGWVSASWIWRDARTDGGAVQGGLNDEFVATIHPRFNENSPFYGDDELYDPEFFEDGEITDWHVLSGDAENPERTEIPSLEDPVTIRTGTCDDPSVAYDRTDDGLLAGVAGASADDRVFLQPTTGSADDVHFERIELTGLEGDATFAFENDRPDGPPESPDDVESLSHLSVETDADVSGTVDFTVDADLLSERELEPDELALYEVNGSAWTESETTVRDDSGGAYHLTANVSSMDGFAVAQQQPEPTDEGSHAYPSPGFEAGAALVVVFSLAVVWVLRDRRG